MSGVGRAGGAGTIVNAFATGRGATFGLDWTVTARVEPAQRTTVWNGRRRLPPAEARVAAETARTVARAVEAPDRFRIDVRSPIPPKKGLKSSSAVAVAVGRAVLDHAGRRMQARRFLPLVADAAVRSGTSLTGALDDAAACLLGGLAFTDNLRRRLLRWQAAPPDLVALVHVAEGSLATGSLRRSDFLPLAPVVARAWRAALDGHVAAAMLVNTLAYAPLVAARPEFTMRCLAAGAWAAGLSGKGPAEIALVHTDEVRRFRRVAPRARVVRLNPGGAA